MQYFAYIRAGRTNEVLREVMQIRGSFKEFLAVLCLCVTSLMLSKAANGGADTEVSIPLRAGQRQIQELLDREAIRQLSVDYCNLVRTRDYDGLGLLFAKNATFKFSDNLGHSGAFNGRDAIKAFYRKSVAGSDPWPFTANYQVELVADGTATGSVYVEIRSGTQNYRVTHIGIYRDHYVREDGVWRFKIREFSAIAVP